MALPQAKSPIPKHAEDRRRHQRVKVNLLGRYMLSDRQEYPCQVVNGVILPMIVIVAVLTLMH